MSDAERSGSLGSPPGKTSGGQKGQSELQNNLQGEPQPLHPGGLLGPGGFPDVHCGGVGWGLIMGSLVVGTVVGWGLGVIVMILGGNTWPPMTVVLPPSVCVCTGG